jgi:outer membrane immunogenic protein
MLGLIGVPMKRLMVAAALAVLAATPALAADMLVKKAPPPRAPAWSWTGFYVGANLGGGFAKTDWFEDVSGSGGGGPPGFQDGSVQASGVLGGGQIGFDWQNGWAVFGIQADADAAGIRGATSCFPQVASIPGVISSQQSCSTKIDALGTVTGRFGAAFDHTLYYVLAGFAWEHERLGNPANIQTIGGPTVANAEFSGNKFGATASAGIERALTANWSVFLQYNYMGFGRRAQVLTDTLGVSAPFTEIIREDIHVIKVGINYRFNWGSPVTASR